MYTISIPSFYVEKGANPNPPPKPKKCTIQSRGASGYMEKVGEIIIKVESY